jgi:hypothetical protein
VLAAWAGLAGCAAKGSDGPVIVEALSASQIPADVLGVAQMAVPGFVAGEAQRKERDGRVYFDVEGVRADGAEVELDILMTAQGPQVVEIQRDLGWQDVPEAVRAATGAAKADFVPVRVIESVQTDGAVIYELFRAGKPADPALEVRLAGGVAEVLAERWEH